MTVYVDNMYEFKYGQYGRMKMSHMIADTEDELHAMAAKVGVARRWYQGDHYDICMSKREQAIKLGAIPVCVRTLSSMVMLAKYGEPMAPHDTAIDRRNKLRKI